MHDAKLFTLTPHFHRARQQVGHNTNKFLVEGYPLVWRYAAFGDEALSGTDQGGKGCVHKIDRMYSTPVEGLRMQG